MIRVGEKAICCGEIVEIGGRKKIHRRYWGFTHENIGVCLHCSDSAQIRAAAITHTTSFNEFFTKGRYSALGCCHQYHSHLYSPHHTCDGLLATSYPWASSSS